MAMVAVFRWRILRLLLARLLVQRMSQPLAVGVAFFIMWIIVGVVFAVRSPDSRWSFVRWPQAVRGAR